MRLLGRTLAVYILLAWLHKPAVSASSKRRGLSAQVAVSFSGGACRIFPSSCCDACMMDSSCSAVVSKLGPNWSSHSSPIPSLNSGGQSQLGNRSCILSKRLGERWNCALHAAVLSWLHHWTRLHGLKTLLDRSLLHHSHPSPLGLFKPRSVSFQCSNLNL